jgi:hypothetical protein
MALGPAAVALGSRVLALCRAALPPEVLSCRRTPQRQELNAVGNGDGNRDTAAMRHGSRYLPPWGKTTYVYFSKFLVRPFIFQKSKKNYKKNLRTAALGEFKIKTLVEESDVVVGSWLWLGPTNVYNVCSRLLQTGLHLLSSSSSSIRIS